MVKVKKNDKENKKKMSDVAQRNGVNHTNLRRSKSVRESLRLIGTKFLHKHDVRKSPSLSNISDEDIFDFDGGIQTILKTPMDHPVSKKHGLFHFDFFNGRKDFTELPEVVAPKAAALLEIPLKDNRLQQPNGKNGQTAYALYRAKRVSKLSESEADKIDEEEDGVEEYRKEFGEFDGTQSFHRNSFRLSMSTKRRNTMWTSYSTSST